MPDCAKCRTNFPNHVVIEGRERNLQRRRYCLKCSPFGVKNTLKLEEAGAAGLCACGTKFKYDRTKGLRRTTCLRCRDQKRRHARKAQAVSYMGGKCSECGYKRSVKALQFHHRDPKKKEFGIGQRMRRSWSVVKKELKKCVLICANCHAEKH